MPSSADPPRRAGRRSRPFKRVLDISLASAGLVATSPLLLVAWLRVRGEDGGPVIYRGRRVGRDGREFEMYKFRTMVPNADQIGGSSTADDDPRLTASGRFLRRYKLDELPQLLNVLKGDMSLVGPRPQVPSEVAGYTVEERELLSVRPGMTDWASIRFHNEGEILRGETDPDLAYARLIRPEKMRLGLEYVRRAGTADDLKIIFQTLALPFRSDSEQETKRDYSSVTETWGLPASSEQVAMQGARYRLAAQVAGTGRTLEVGCGSGMGLAYLQNRGAEMFGGDYTQALLREAASHVPNARLARLDATSLPFADQSFDTVLLLEMIYYVSSARDALAEARRVLRAEGRAVVCLPNRERRDFNPSPFATGYPSARELVELLDAAGFDDVALYGGFAAEHDSNRDRGLAPLRRLAVRFHLIPRSMRMKALVKRLLYGRLPRLGLIQDTGAPYELTEMDLASADLRTFKNLYAVARRRA